MSGTLAVVSQTGCSLSLFDLGTGERTAHLTDLISEPHELLLDSKRDLLYLTHAYHHGNFWVHGDSGCEISVIDPHKKKVTGVIDISPARGPHAILLDEARDQLWCSYEERHSETGGILAIDLTTHKVVKTIQSGAKTHWFVTTPDFKKAYTCNKTAEFISVLDLEKGSMIGKIEAPGGTEECSMSVDGKFAFFPNPGFQYGVLPETPVIYVVDTATDDVVDCIRLEQGALSAHVTKEGRMMVAQYRFDVGQTGIMNMVAPGQLAIYEPGTYKHAGSVDVGKVPLTLRSSPDGKLGFTANIHEGTVSVVDLTTMKLIRTLTVDTEVGEISKMCQGAHGMVYWPQTI